MRGLALTLAAGILAQAPALAPSPSDGPVPAEVISTPGIPPLGGGPLEALEGQYQALFQAIAPSVVVITHGDTMGSGFFLREDGLILTNAHVVRGRTNVTVQLRSGRRMEGVVVERATEDIDLALVKIPLTRAPVPPLGRLGQTPVGAWLGAVGHGRGSVWTFNMGILSNSYSDEGGRSVFQTQIPLNPGNSGGPIFNRRGEVIGVVTKGISDANNINFGIALELAYAKLPSLASACRCVTVSAPPGVAVFLDGQMAGVGPSLSLPVDPGDHAVFIIVDGQMQQRTFTYPQTDSLSFVPE